MSRIHARPLRNCVAGLLTAALSATLTAALLGSISVPTPAPVGSARTGGSPVSLTRTLGSSIQAGGKVTRDQVIKRAQAWVDQKVPYSANGLRAPYSFWPDSTTGERYRQDCSGYVSMAWQLKSSLSTHSLPSVATRIPTAELKPGDILNATGHVLIFGGWTNQARGEFTYYQQSSRARPTHKAEGSIHAARLAGHPTSSYTALRYKNIIDTPTTPAVPDRPVKNPPVRPTPPPPPAQPAPGTRDTPAAPDRPVKKRPVRPTPPASPTTPAPDTGHPARETRNWVNASSGKCLEIRGDTTSNGDLASQWDCNKSATQYWTSSRPGIETTFTNANSRLCLEVRADAVHNGANANQWQCNGSATQRWHQKAAPGGGWNLINANSGKCLQINNGDTANGAITHQRDCDGSPAQKWL
ncbi:RICIN domain-containing protein [Streptomyces sp. NPDC057638]|uniref:RICIN domain-containing protein n=1 Tax=Streptomyces sp. NPDC057638 TaxID=3346190 RepID=UPI003697AF07